MGLDVAGADPELLRLELGELKLSGFDLSLTGFGDLELKDIMAERTEGLTDPDDAPEAPEHPVSHARARVEAGNQRPWPADKVRTSSACSAASSRTLW
jgi:hypothetical protein